MKTYTAKPETVQRDWFVVDAAGQTLVVWRPKLPAACVASTSLSTPAR